MIITHIVIAGLQLPLETERLLIRRFTLTDTTALLSYASDPAVMTWIPAGPMTLGEIDDYATINTSDDATDLMVVHRQAVRIIGHIVFHPWFAVNTWEIGWVFHPAYHGQGYATEAARAVADHAFHVMKIHRLIATCQPQNPASWRVMEKLGMRREGHFLRCIHRGGDVWWDEYFYAALAEEWQMKRDA
jgi:ribosomal-protein-alanine N-acetyltransferase